MYQAGIMGAQDLCERILTDKEVRHTPAVDDWCVLVLRGRAACTEP